MATQWRYFLPAPARRFPADLAAVVGWTALTVLAVATPIVRETPLRIVVGLPFLLFLPGYAFVALLFPEAGEPPAGVDGAIVGGGDAASGAEGARVADDQTPLEEAREEHGAADDYTSEADGTDEHTLDPAIGSIPGQDRGIDGIERVALSFGLSIAIVPLLGLALNFTPWGIRLWPILTAVALFTVGCAVGASARRAALPVEERFRVPYRTWLRRAHSEAFEPTDGVDAALNVLLALSILLAVGTAGYAIAVPSDGEQFTEFYVLTEDSDEELVAANYPEELTEGDTAELVLGIGNQEHEPVDYTVVAQFQRVETANNETTVVERQELDRIETTLAHNETWHSDHEVTPPTTGEDLRLQYLLYREDVPDSPTAENAYRDIHLWMDVVES